MPNPENIKEHEYKKGQSGNPNGRPKGRKNRSTLMRYWIDTPSEEMDNCTQEDDIILALIQKAKKGDVTAFQEIVNTLYGKMPDKVQGDFNLNKHPLEFFSSNGKSKDK